MHRAVCAGSILLGTLITVGLWQLGSEKKLGQLAQAGYWGCPLGYTSNAVYRGGSLLLGLADGESEAPEPQLPESRGCGWWAEGRNDSDFYWHLTFITS